MRADELRMEDLLELPSTGGVLRFGGQRALLYDAAALGLLRHQLIEAFGVTATRGLLTRLGYSHGYRTAEGLKSALPWDDEREWRIAGGRLHRLQGLVEFEPVPAAQRLHPDAFAEALWRDSYEAEQHVLHCGRAAEPVCWSLAGFASGYLSYVTGEPIYCVEARCCGKGDAVCHMVGRRAADWGDRLEAIRAPYERACLDASLRTLRDTLHTLEGDVRRRRRLMEPAPAPDAGMVARSHAMRRVLELSRKAARVDATVLVTGESGVGKERVARFLHEESARSGGPFVAINCGALPETLLESELFGHAKGAFTGAGQAREGLFEAARGGSLFLDEIGEMPLALQTRLLRVLQEREVRRLGENTPRPVDVRVLAATNRRLKERVAEGAFREDLYYRLQVIEIEIPPLRERPDDILPLARWMLAAAGDRVGRSMEGIAPGAAKRLLAHTWPGNVRELHNAVERAVVFAEGALLGEEDLSWLEVPTTPETPLEATLADVERAHIGRVLADVGGHRATAALRLGISEATLFRRLRQYRQTET
ncbi:MAG: sigma 54-interacting transcriptional regulator [Sandaracinaceae bacterium]